MITKILFSSNVSIHPRLGGHHCGIIPLADEICGLSELEGRAAGVAGSKNGGQKKRGGEPVGRITSHALQDTHEKADPWHERWRLCRNLLLSFTL